MDTNEIQELKNLIQGLDRKIDVKFAELDKKIDVKFAEVNGELKVTNERIDSLKNLMSSIEKRLANEEVLTRTVFAGIILAVIGAVFKVFFFADKV